MHKGAGMRSGRGLQSAMEYLMTYGWSILLIAIVVSTLYSLGVFNAANFAPRAQPNSCRVFRPNGAGSITNINLEGTCNDQLPQYVASFNGQAYVQLPAKATLNSLSNWTISVWIYQSSGFQHDVYTEGTPSVDFGFSQTSSQLSIDICSTGCWTDYAIPTTQFKVNQWQYMTIELSNANSITGTISLYINGQLQGTSGGRTCCGGGTTILGGEVDGGMGTPVTTTYQGYMSNLQLYNTALDANTIMALYQQGIGSAPLTPQYLIGWWPLNGDTKDYGGNGYNGAPTNVIFTSSWTNAYNLP